MRRGVRGRRHVGKTANSQLKLWISSTRQNTSTPSTGRMKNPVEWSAFPARAPGALTGTPPQFTVELNAADRSLANCVCGLSARGGEGAMRAPLPASRGKTVDVASIAKAPPADNIPIFAEILPALLEPDALSAAMPRSFQERATSPKNARTRPRRTRGCICRDRRFTAVYGRFCVSFGTGPGMLLAHQRASGCPHCYGKQRVILHEPTYPGVTQAFGPEHLT